MKDWFSRIVRQIDELGQPQLDRAMRLGLVAGASVWGAVIVVLPVLHLPSGPQVEQFHIVPTIFASVRLGLLPALFGFCVGFLFALRGDRQ